MGINWSSLSSGFSDALYNTLVALEANTQQKRWHVTLVEGKATIGVGFDLKAGGPLVQNEVFAALGLQSTVLVLQHRPTDPVKAIEFDYVQKLRQAITDGGGQATLDAIMAERAGNTDPEYKQYIGLHPRVTFSFNSDAEVRQVFDTLWKNVYGLKISKRFPFLAPVADQDFQSSRERIALACLVWNGGEGLLSKDLGDAIASGNRAEAWYQIRYRLNKKQDKGIAKRRYLESEIFGLYASPAAATIVEAQQTYAMLTAHRADILAKEARWGVSADGARGWDRANNGNTSLENAQGDAAFVSFVLDDGTVNTLVENLEPARNSFIAWLNSQLPAGASSLVASDWNAAAIYYRPTAAGQTLTTDATDGNGKGGTVEHNLESNILVGGDGLDTLVGGAGTDVLIGGGGADTLVGGPGSDALYGGIGEDIYVWNPATDGVDTIIDPDGGTLVIVDPASGASYSLGGTFLRQAVSGAALTWIDASGRVVLTHNSPWRITLSDGSVIQLGEDFDPAAWGITLQDQPAASTSTLSGDFIKATSGGAYITNANGYDSVGNQPDTQDVINGGTASETIHGLGGNDGLAGGDGDDVIDGGAGNDLILGGWGADTISGGDGNDEILGSAYGLINRPTSTNFTPPAASGAEIARGFSWVIYDSPDGVSRVVAGTTGLAPNGETVGNIIDGGAGTDRIGAGTGDDIAHGGADDDVVLGMGGNDVLFGDGGADQLWGDGFGGSTTGWYTPYSEHGNDTLYGGVGNDVLRGQGGRDFLFGDEGDDELIGDDTDEVRTPSASHGSDYLDGGSGNDSLWGGGGNDNLFGGAGNDTLVGDSAGLDVGYHGSDYLDGGDGSDTLSGDGGDDWLVGGAGDDYLQGDSASVPSTAHGKDLLDGGLGDDTLVGGGGSDTLLGGDGNDMLHGDASNVPTADQGDDILAGGAGDDEIVGYGGNDTLIGGAGVDSLSGGDGDDTYVFEAGDAVVSAHLEADTIADSVGDNVVQINGVSSNDIDLELSANGEALVLLYGTNERVAVRLGSNVSFDLDDGRFSFSELIGSRAAGAVNFSDGVNTFLIGGSGSDSLLSSGSATLSGGRGSDVLTGTGGFNTYLYSVGDGSDHIADTSAKTDAQGLPTPNTLRFGSWITEDDLRLGVASGSLTISVGWDPSDVVYIEGFNAADALSTHPIDRFEFTSGTVLTYAELLTLGIDINGTSGNDTLTGTSVDDRIDGGAGNDTLSGGTGSDTYFWGVGSGNDTVNNVDASSGRIDTIQITSALMPADVLLARAGEDLTIYSLTTADSIRVTNYFNGAAIDQLAFADGTVWHSADIASRLAVGSTPGNDVITGTSGDDAIAGLAGDDTITAIAGNDSITGGAGNDWISGGVGSDIYLFSSGHGSDMIVENGSAADVDIIRFSAGIQESGVTVQRVGTDALLQIGATDQIRIVGAWDPTATSADRVERIEFANGVAWTEQDLRNRALASMTTSAADVITGFDGDDVIHGGSGEDTLYGLGGNDTLLGEANFDVLHGGDGDDVLVGGARNDDLYGGQGNDTFLFGDEGTSDSDEILAEPGSEGGTDRILFAAGIAAGDVTWSRYDTDGLSVTYTSNGYTNNINIPDFFTTDVQPLVDRIELADGTAWTYQSIKGSFLAGTAGDDTLLGTSSADSIDGQDGDDSINAVDGNDIIVGGHGDDLLDGGAGSDVYRYSIGDGKDHVHEDDPSEVDVIELKAGILPADVQLYRRSSHLTILVGDSDSQLQIQEYFNPAYAGKTIEIIRFADGTQWNASDIAARVVPVGTQNTMTGTAGNDTFTVDNELDQITEGVGQGTDTAVASVDYTLPANVENLTLVGPLDLRGRGNSLANILTGNSSDNYLEGWGGVDTFIGGLGDDTFGITTVEGLSSQFIENAGEGFDTIEVWLSVPGSGWLWLPDNVEKAIGHNRVDLYGNDLDNVLDGRYLADWTTINGRTGADVMIGNPSTRQYFYVDNPGDVIIDAGPGRDDVYSSVSYTLAEDAGPDSVSLEMGDASTATGNSNDNYLRGNTADNALYGLAGNDTLDPGIAGTDVLMGGLGDDIYIVDRSTGVTITEAIGEGTDLVVAGVTYTLAANVENLILDGYSVTGYPAINGTGNSLDNVLTGNDAANVLTGGLGNDTYVVSNGDTVVENAGEGTDTVRSDVSWTLGSNLENLTLTGLGSDTGTGNAADNVLDGSLNQEANTLAGGQGNDTYVVGGVDVVVEAAGEGVDFVLSSVSYTLSANVENLTLTGLTDSAGTGNDAANVLTGNGGANTLDGRGGADTMIGGAGNDTYVVDSVGDQLIEQAGEGKDLVQSSVSYVLSANVENLTLTGSAAITGTGNALDNRLDGSQNAAANTLVGGSGNDTYVVGAGDVVVENAGEGTDRVEAAVSFVLSDNVEVLMLTGGNAANGTGNALNNSLTGNGADNVLDGGAGADQMVGGLGNDTYVVDNTADVVQEQAGEGTDTIQSSITLTLGANVENLVLIGSSAINATGNTLANQITGNTGANVLDGGTGTDQMAGGLGDDTYVVDNVGDVVSELANEGNDLVRASITYVLNGNVERLTLTGSGNINGTGNSLDNVITGYSGANVLDGGLGADTLVGGAGNDTYVVDNAADVIVESAGAGTDLVQSSATYALSANLENLTLTGTAAINGTGNDLSNVLTGNSAANVLAGGLGNDTYVVDNVGDLIVENAGEGTDTVQSSVSYALAANVENLTLTGSGTTSATGNDLVNTLTGNASDNVLDGGLGADTLVGGAGNDTYVVTAGDTVTEGASAGTDLVIAAVTWTLASNVENLTLSGTAAVDGTGNSLANVITGNAAANVLDGGTGADQLIGGLGDDTYVIDNAGDVITELAGEGTDLVKSSIAYTLGATLENLTLTGTTAINGTGNGLDNRLDGSTNSAANVLTGGLGDDTYVVGTGDTIVENTGEGVDAVFSAVTYTLGVNVENLTLTGSSAVSGTGNTLNNAIAGNTGANVLDGGAGADTLSGGLGNDTYVVDNTSDTVIENASEGTDLVQASVSYTLTANVENLTLTGTNAINGTGNDLVNTLTGNSADNVLDGGLGADTLVGGTGNDTYVVGTGDTVTEAASAGTDTVVADVSWTLGSNLENLTLSGVAAINGTGNTLANVIVGNAAANVLDGGTGADQMSGGAGDDVYVIDNAADVVTELTAQGTDLVQSSIAWTLGANVENLTLTGSGVITGTGNALDNVLTGNSGANVLTGGMGNDTYVVGTGDTVTENTGEGTDTVQASITWTLGANVENLTLTGATAINGTGNTLANVLNGNSGNNTLDGSTGADQMSGGQGNDTYVVESAGDVVTEAAGEGTDLVNSSVTFTLGNNVENLALTGTTAINGTGNVLDNVLTGNSAVNTLTGGAGNDTYVVTAGDVIVENVGEGTDIVQSAVTWTLGSNIENLTLTGSTAVNGTGNALDNVLTGNSAANVLTGGLGNDTYVVGTGDTVTENAGEGTDTVQSSVTWTLGANIENLTLTGSSAVNGTGNTLDNVLVGNTGNNTLTGGAGNDTLVGGAGNDIYVVDSALDIITENAGEGTDTVQSVIAWTLAANVENLTLTGSTAVNGTGNTLDNVLTGNSAVNTLTGGAGNDTYVVTAGDVVVENAGEGTDLVQSAVAWTLGSNIENLTLTGSSAINGTGNGLDNILTGNTGNNTMTGGGGNDTLDGGSTGTDVLVGGQGNDTYIVGRTTGITITESAGEGIDGVNASVTHTLAGNVELLFQTGSTAINGTGNALANLLRGNSAVNTLAGGGGNDILEGGGGNDILSNTAGNSLFNGGSGVDSLTAADGNDLLIGGVGNDSITTGLGTDIIAFNKGDGADTIAASTGTDNTLSIGGGALYADLLFQKSGTDLILKVGAADQITFVGYYSGSNRSVSTLQMVIDGTSDYLPGGADVTRDNKVETFNFAGLVAAFDAALLANPSLTSWSLTNAMASQYLDGSDVAAIGGDLAYRYNRFGTLSDVSYAPATSILSAASFGGTSQALQALSTLQDSTARLS